MRRGKGNNPGPWGFRRFAAPMLVLSVIVCVFISLSPGAAEARSFAFGLHVREPMGVLPLHGTIAATTGAEAVPVRFGWAEAEPTPGRFSVRKQEVFIDALKGQGLKVVGVLEYPSDMALPTADASRRGWPSGHPDDWAFFVSHVVSRFRDDVDAWIIDGGRKPDATDLFQAAGAEGYAAFVRITSGTVRRNEPVKLLLAVAPGTDDGWLELFIHYGGLAAVDGLALDVNRWPAPPSGLGVVMSSVEERARQAGQRPLLWVWDYGYPTHEGIPPGEPGVRGVSPDKQAVYAVQSHVRLLAAGAEAVFYKELLNQGADPSEPEHHFGMYTWALEPKPAFHAYATMTNMLTGLHYARGGDVIRRPMLPEEPGDDIIVDGMEADTLPYHFVFDYEVLKSQVSEAGQVAAAHVFTGEAGTVIVLWAESPVGEAGTCRDGCGQNNILPWLDGVPVRAYDLYGRPLTEQAGWQPGDAAIYIELPMEMVP